MTRDQWLDAFAQEIGNPPPTREEIDAILELAATAAHASERSAAPVTAWLAGRSGRPLGSANDAAQRVSVAAEGADGA